MLVKRFLNATALTCFLLSASASFAQTVGPSGEAATPSSAITLSDADLASLKDKGYKAALLWHTSSDFVNAVSAGAKDEFARAGVKVVVTTDAGFDAARQRSDIETALAAKPDVVLALPLDPVTSAELDQLIVTLQRVLGLTVVIVTHELGSIFSIVDRCIVLDRETRSIAAEGHPRDLKDSTDPRVGGFFNRRPRAA